MPDSQAVCCPFCGECEAMACALDTKPKSYAVVCRECGAQGPSGDSFEQANREWIERAPIVIGGPGGGWFLFGFAVGALREEGVSFEQMRAALDGAPIGVDE